MREVMRQIIKDQAFMEIVGEVVDPFELPRIARDTMADMVIVALEDIGPLGVSSFLFAECPNVTILALASKSNAACIEQLRLGRREIPDPSEANILIALRQALQTP
jgi:AmiR/NasT family two-component response regulator